MTSSSSARRKIKFTHGKSTLSRFLLSLNQKLNSNFKRLFELRYQFHFFSKKSRVKIKKLATFFKFLYFFFQYTFFTQNTIFVLFCADDLPKKRGRGGPDKKPRKRGPEHKNYKHGLGKTRGCNTERYAAWKERVLR